MSCTRRELLHPPSNLPMDLAAFPAFGGAGLFPMMFAVTRAAASLAAFSMALSPPPPPPIGPIGICCCIGIGIGIDICIPIGPVIPPPGTFCPRKIGWRAPRGILFAPVPAMFVNVKLINGIKWSKDDFTISAFVWMNQQNGRRIWPALGTRPCTKGVCCVDWDQRHH